MTTTQTAPVTSTSTPNALAKTSGPLPEIIRTPDEFRSALRTWTEQRYNVLSPFADIGGLAPSHGVFFSVVKLSAEKTSEETYSGVPWLKAGTHAPAKRGLRKIAEGLGISTKLQYVSVGVVRHYWHVKAVASYRGVDGAVVEREASQEWDLRDGSDRMKGWTKAQIEEARKHGLRQCETRAINAAIRECGCGIKQAYTTDELARPFLAVRVMFTPDMTNPDERRVVLERALGGTSTLYPQHGTLPAPSGDAFDDEPPAEPKPVGRGSTTTNAPATPAAKGDEPPTPDAVKIAKVESKEFTYQNGAKKGQKGLRYLIIDSKGVEYSTFSETHFKDASRFKAEDAWVEIATETNGGYTNIIEIVKAGTQPDLPSMDEV